MRYSLLVLGSGTDPTAGGGLPSAALGCKLVHDQNSCQLSSPLATLVVLGCGAAWPGLGRRATFLARSGGAALDFPSPYPSPRTRGEGGGGGPRPSPFEPVAVPQGEGSIPVVRGCSRVLRASVVVRSEER